MTAAPVAPVASPPAPAAAVAAPEADRVARDGMGRPLRRGQSVPATSTLPPPIAGAMPQRPPVAATAPRAAAAAGPTKTADAYELTNQGFLVAGAGTVVACAAIITLMALRGSAGTGVLFALLLVVFAALLAWNYGVVASAAARWEVDWLRRIPMPPRLVATTATSTGRALNGPEADWRRERLDRITRLAERVIYDLGMLLAGHRPELDYMAAEAATQLTRTVSPFLASGDRMIPDFSDVSLTVQWTRDHSRPIRATATFVDRSTRHTLRGETIALQPREVTVRLTVDPAAGRILDIAVASGQRPLSRG